MLEEVEKSKHKAIKQEIINEITNGIKRFISEYKNSKLKNITFVVYNDNETMDLLSSNFS